MASFPLRFDGAHVFVAGGSSGINLGIGAMFLSPPFASDMTGVVPSVDGGSSIGRFDPDLLGQFGKMGITSQV